MLHPYGGAPAPRDRCLVDDWIGDGWRLLERHELDVAAPAAVSLAALSALRIRELPAVRVLLALRGMPFRPGMTLGAFFSTPPFVRLAEEPGRELVGGIMIPPRDGEGRRTPPVTPDAFRAALGRTPMAALATFRAEPSGAGSVLWTETWVRTSGALAATAFEAYWLAIGPWSAWIRRMFLRAASARAVAAVPARVAR